MSEEFKLKGLNLRADNKGCYATVDLPNEDWFHANFDESKVSAERQLALFYYFKNGNDSVWKDNENLKAIVQFEKWSTGNVPVNPIIIGIKNLQ